MTRKQSCPECGTLSNFNLKIGTAEVWCPACLAAFAQAESEKLKTAKPVERSPLPPDLAGKERLGKFVLAVKVGSGGSGEVWKAWDTVLGRWVALKLFHEEDPKDLARLTREAETAAKLSHPHIASIHEIGQEKGRHYLAMQYVDGVTLLKYPRRDRKALVRIVRDAARAVAEAHRQGIVHRDLKPANLAVAQHGEGKTPHVYVLDFGLARRIEGGDKLTATGIVVGTPAYLPPEQARGEKLDGRADIYALGATLYHVLTGRPPFKGANVFEVLKKVQDREPARPRQLVPSVERDLETITLKCLEKETSRRYATADDLGDDLDRWLDGEPIQARPPGWFLKFRKAAARRKLALAVSGLALFVAVAGTWWFTSGKPERDYLRHFEAGMRSWDEMRGMVFGKVNWNRLKARAIETGAHFDRALQVRETGMAHVMRARCHEYMWDLPAARRALERACALNPADAEASCRLARILLLNHYNANDHEPSVWSVWHSYPSDGSESYHFIEAPTPTAHSGSPVFQESERLLRVGETEATKNLLDGLRAVASGRWDEAARLLLKHIERDPLDFPVLDIVSLCFEYAGKLERAETARIRSVNLVQNPNALVNLAKIQMALQKWAESEQTCDELLKSTPDHVEARLLRARLRTIRGRPEEAIADFTRILEMYPRSAEALAHRGEAHVQLKNFDEAVEDMTRAIDLNPANMSGYLNRANAYLQKGILERALPDTDLAASLKPEVPVPLFYRASVRVKLGDFAGTIEDCTRALKLGMGFGPLLLLRAEAHAALGDLDSQMRDIDEAISMNPTRAHYRNLKGVVLFRVGREEEAIAALSKAIELNPKLAEPLRNRAMIYAGRGQEMYAAALEDLRKAVELNPDPLWICNLGCIMTGGAHYEEALRVLQGVEQLGHVCQACPVNRARCKDALGDPEGALKDFDEAVRQAGDDGEIYLLRGEFRMGRNQRDEAIEDYKTACRLLCAALGQNLQAGWNSDSRWTIKNAWYSLHRACVRLATLKEFDLAVRGFHLVFESRIEDSLRWKAAFNLGCYHAHLGQKEPALDWIDKAVATGMDDLPRLETDSDLNFLRSEPRFLEALRRVRLGMKKIEK